MIPNQWYAIYPARKLGRRPVGLRRMEERLALWRDTAGAPRVVLDRCPHRGMQLSRGKVRDGAIECPYHGFRFDGEGRCRLMPCEGTDAKIPPKLRAHPFAVREAHGLIWLWWGEPDAARAEVPWFDDVDPAAPFVAAEWPLDYVRSVESNFDFHHLPFVHGRLPNSGPRLDPYEVTVDGTHIRTRGVMRQEDRERGLEFEIEYKPAALTLIRLSRRARILVADCPIDAHTTWRYACYDTNYTRIPGLRYLISWLVLQVDWQGFQRMQDLRIAKGLPSERPPDGTDHLVRADAGTAAYRKLRRRLLREAGVSDEEARVLRDAS